VLALAPAFLLVSMLAGTSPALAATSPPVPPPGTAPGGQLILDTSAHPALDWSLPPRYSASWAAYHPGTASYDSAFVNPASWGLDLNACGSTAVHRITGYSFTVTRLGTSWQRTYRTAGCTLHLRHTLPAQGYYPVNVTVHTFWPAAEGVSQPLRRIVAVRDYLLVSMGDSLASGEGNPDVSGSYSYQLLRDWSLIHRVEHKAARWRDQRCHRSARSGPALAAKALEDADPKTSVTFVSVACSGAELKHLISDRYAGIAPSGSLTMPPQVDAVAALTGPGSPRGGRPIDALTISAGINDLGFGDIVKRCAMNNNLRVGHTDCVTSGGIGRALDTLPAKYRQLAGAIHVKLPGVREIYLNDYPADVFRDGGCGLLGLPGVGIDSGEGGFMQVYGNRLNNEIRKATDRFRGDAYRWNMIGDLALPFSPHGYCDSPAWFNSIERSAAIQGDVEGTAHPNAVGHAEYARLLRRAIVLDQAAKPYRTLRVTITAVKLPERSGGTAPVDIKLFRFQNDLAGTIRRIQVPQDGKWTPVAPAEGRFTLPVYLSPATPRHAVQLDMILDSILPIHHTYSDAYGAGSHTVVHPAGQISARYTVEVLAPPPSGPVVSGSALSSAQ
jgi:hypothetical protein